MSTNVIKNGVLFVLFCAERGLRIGHPGLYSGHQQNMLLYPEHTCRYYPTDMVRRFFAGDVIALCVPGIQIIPVTDVEPGQLV